MLDLNQVHVTELQRRSKDGQYGIAVFIGAGCSSALRIPLWTDLLIGLNRAFPYYSTDQEVIDDIYKIGYAEVASRIKSKASNEADYKSEIKKYLQPVACHFTSLHLEIIRLSKVIVTTNYDKSFEEALQALERLEPNSSYKHSSWGLGDFNIMGLGVERKVFHIHGDSDTLDIVLTAESYQEIYNDELTGVAVFISTIFSTITTLFIGFSFNDRLFSEFLKNSFERIRSEKLRRNKPFPKHYCILSNNLNKKYVTTDQLIGNKQDIDTLINANILISDSVLEPGETVFRFAGNSRKEIADSRLDSKVKAYLNGVLNEFDNNDERLALLKTLDIEIIFFEGDKYLENEYILREINKEAPLEVADSFTP